MQKGEIIIVMPAQAAGPSIPRCLVTLSLSENSDNFVFDNEMLVQDASISFKIGEIGCPARYFEEASSIDFARSVKYGFGFLSTTLKYFLQKHGMVEFLPFNSNHR